MVANHSPRSAACKLSAMTRDSAVRDRGVILQSKGSGHLQESQDHTHQIGNQSDTHERKPVVILTSGTNGLPALSSGGLMSNECNTEAMLMKTEASPK